MPKEFVEFYESHDLSKTADHFGVSKGTISNWVRRIDFRKQGHGIHAATVLSNKQLELVLGSLLGDGSLQKINENTLRNSHFYERHSLAQKQYLEWKRSILLPISGEMRYSTTAARVKDKLTGKVTDDDTRTYQGCHFRTATTRQLGELEKKWYLRDVAGDYILDDKGWRIKIVPNDLILTPFMLFVWYMDDGHNDHAAYSRRISICSHSFSEKENCFLVSQIQSLGFPHCSVKPDKDKFQIVFGAKGYFDFMDFIKSFTPPNDMLYKCDTSLAAYINGPPSEPFSEDDFREILDMRYKQKFTLEQIAKVKDTSFQRISYALQQDDSYKLVRGYKEDDKMTGIRKRGNSYQASIGNGKGATVVLGSFDSFEKAKEVRMRAVELRNVVGPTCLAATALA
jgi:hypothetical protein